MDPTVRTALIAAGGIIASATISALTSIWVSGNDLKTKTQQVEYLNKKVQSNLEQTSNLFQYVYDNGTLTSKSFSGGKMVVRVNGSGDNRPISFPIDMNRFIELCGDENGCSITLGATRFRFEAQPQYYISEAPLQGAPCRFFWIKATRSWSLSQYCVAIYGLFSQAPGTSQYTFNHAYQIYEGSNSVGRDDSATGGVDTDGQSLIIMGFKNACYLAESAADTVKGKGALMPDDPAQPSTGKGLFLIASAPSWDFPGAYPLDSKGQDTLWPSNDPQRRCELIVED